MEDISFLRNVTMFSDLDDESLKEVYSILHKRNYKRGKIIFMEGEPGEAFFFVISGMVKIYKSSSDGREHIIHIFGPGHVFAETTLFDNINYPATAEVIEDGTIGMIRSKDLEELIMNNSSLALQLIKVLSKRLVMASYEIMNMAFNDTVQRTAVALIKLSKSHGVKTEDGIELNLDITRQELADVVGSARETVTRALTRLKNDGAIEIGSSIIIRDIDKLSSWIV